MGIWDGEVGSWDGDLGWGGGELGWGIWGSQREMLLSGEHQTKQECDGGTVCFCSMANAILTGETCKLKPECSTVLKAETALSDSKGWEEGEHSKLLMELCVATSL